MHGGLGLRDGAPGHRGDARDDAEAALVAAGPEVGDGSQNRAAASAARSDYFELTNNRSGDDTVIRARHDDTFNDLVRIVWPRPG